MKRRDYYEVLEISQKATPDEIKQAYRKMAIKWHPDKNSSEDAKERFQEIGEAYNVLSDPNERTWYDHHKDQILRSSTASGIDENDEKYEDLLTYGLDIWTYFERHCFGGFDDSEDGFYTVYRKVFEVIKAEEEKAKNKNEKYDDDSYDGVGGKAAPGFGDSKTSDEKVVDFYTFWENFSTFKTFSWKDLYNPNESGYNRQIKRLIEKDNNKERQKGKKKYLDTIKSLVQYVKKRDPRYQEYIKNTMMEKQRKAEEQRKKEEEKKKELEELKKKRREEEAERYHREYEQQKALGLIVGEEEAENVHYEDWFCEICDKEFRTQNQLENHKQSKAHAKKLKDLMKEMMLEEEKEAFENAEENEEPIDKTEEPNRTSKKKKKKNKKKNKKTQDEDDENDEEEDLETKAPETNHKKNTANQNNKTHEEGNLENKQNDDKKESEDEVSADDDFDFAQFVQKKPQKNTKLNKKEVDNYQSATQSDKIEEKNIKSEEIKEEKNVSSGQEVKEEKEENQEEEEDVAKDGENQSESVQPEKKLGKAKLKKLKKQEKAKQQEGLCCNVCKMTFETRNKLFQHVKESNHEYKVA